MATCNRPLESRPPKTPNVQPPPRGLSSCGIDDAKATSKTWNRDLLRVYPQRTKAILEDVSPSHQRRCNMSPKEIQTVTNPHSSQSLSTRFRSSTLGKNDSCACLKQWSGLSIKSKYISSNASDVRRWTTHKSRFALFLQRIFGSVSSLQRHLVLQHE